MIHLLVKTLTNRNNNDNDNKLLHRTNNKIKNTMNNIETNDNSKNILVRLSRKIKLRKEINHIDNNKTGYYTRRPMKNTTYETVTKKYTNLLRTNTDNIFY